MKEYANVLVCGENSTHRIMIRKWHENADYTWTNGYTYHGRVWGLKYPKVGRVFQNQLGDRFKVVRLGSDWDERLNSQVECAYVIPWSGK